MPAEGFKRGSTAVETGRAKTDEYYSWRTSQITSALPILKSLIADKVL